MRFRVLVADDEPLARGMVAGFVRDDPDILDVAECESGRTLLEAVSREHFDILFLDIEMPDVTGLHVAEGLRQDPPAVVFITAFSRYAAPAFDVGAVDYVLKPFSDERFREALRRAKQRVRERRLGELAEQTTAVMVTPPDTPVVGLSSHPGPYLQHLPVKEKERTVVWRVSEITWIKAEDYCVLVHSRRGRHLLRASLASLEKRLDPRLFVRVHRTAIVNLAEVAEIVSDDGLTIVLSDRSRIRVSRSRRASIEALLLPRFR